MPQLILILTALINILFYLLYQHYKRIKGCPQACAVSLKIIPVLCSACLAAYGAIETGTTGYWLLCAGIFVCMAADWVIDYHLVPGMGIFAIGHIAYCTGFMLLSSPTGYNLLIFSAVFIPFLWLYHYFFKKKGVHQQPVLFLCYAVLLCIMVGLASSQKIMLFVGGICFAISDGMLGWRMIKNVHSKLYDNLCMGLYYLAQYLIAASTLI